jgi:hypothetical protein
LRPAGIQHAVNTRPSDPERLVDLQASRRPSSPRRLKGVCYIPRHRHPGGWDVVGVYPHAVHDHMPVDNPLRGLQVAAAHRCSLVLYRDAGGEDLAGDALRVLCTAPGRDLVVSPRLAGGVLDALAMEVNERLGLEGR